MVNKHKNDMFEDMMRELDCADELTNPWVDPDSILRYKNYQERVLWIDKDINDTLYDEIRHIIQWNREDEANNIPVEDRKPITCIIHSYGGTLDAAFSFIDCVDKSKTIVKTVNIGSAMSAGALIFLSGTPGYRYCMQLSTALIHDGSGGAQGTYAQVQSQNANYKHVMDTMKDWIAAHTKIDKATLKKWNNKEIYLYAQDQLKYGIADKIVNSLADIF